MDVFLETERMLLRRFTESDVDNLVTLDGDPRVMRFLNGGDPISREEIETEVLPEILDHYKDFEEFGFWAAIEKGTGEFLGWFEFRPRDGGGVTNIELGYRLRSSAWGKGYATEGARALIHKGFAEFGVRSVTATTMTVNVASRRVMEKAGLTLVRTFHQPWPAYVDGAEHGDVEYRLAREEWQRRQTTTP
ncbi:MAG: GNAT family N-acetyltransferase [Pseudonocardiaceae bacterium]|nr:GNAT family N-acetyltransferase [Pseudonocardiaceae bacterium]